MHFSTINLLLLLLLLLFAYVSQLFRHFLIVLHVESFAHMAEGVSVIITVVRAAIVAFAFELSTRRARYAHRSIVRVKALAKTKTSTLHGDGEVVCDGQQPLFKRGERCESKKQTKQRAQPLHDKSFAQSSSNVREQQCERVFG